MDDYNGTHESGHFMELLMDGDYRNYYDDHDGGDYNNADNNNDGDNNDDDDGESSDSDSDDDDSMTILMRSLTSLWQLPVKQL